ncbi:LOW QUALITY PROTEIN: glycoprotein x [Plakobranchus ocellatus]|uniref:Glycoprotein x n=1 Tax=Plakobranchus ocellatus TaxID=259542 RepID=A0AAV4B813_9GAST|nr:LOW QUALITY PROTEIN: glycoprotein x [Plakobranchus ocellatus]
MITLPLDAYSLFWTSDTSRLMIIYFDEYTYVGVFFFTLRRLVREPHGVVLSESMDSKGSVEFVVSNSGAFGSRSGMYCTPAWNISLGYGFGCGPKTRGIWTISNNRGNDSLIVQVFLNTDIYQSNDLPSGLESHMYFLDEYKSSNANLQYYRLIFLPKGCTDVIETLILYKLADAEVYYWSIKITWTNNLADYVFIFLSLNGTGIKCELQKKCGGQFTFTKFTPATALIYVEIDQIETMNSSAVVFLTDKSQTDFRIYSLSSNRILVAASSDSSTPPPNDDSANPLSEKVTTILLAVFAGACLIALVAVLTFIIVRSRKLHSHRENDHQTASNSPQRRTSDGYEVLPGDRISGDHEHIEEDRRLEDSYEAMIDEDVSGNVFCNRRASFSNHYETISLENLRTSPQGASALSQKEDALFNLSKSCGNLTGDKANSFEFADDKKAPTEQEPKPIHSTLYRQNSKEEDQPRLHWFMFRDSIDDVPCVTNAFISRQVKDIELQHFSTRRCCLVGADGEGDYLTVLDSNTEQHSSADADGDRDYLTLLDSSTEQISSANADGDRDYLTLLDSSSADADRDIDYLAVLDSGIKRSCLADVDGEGDNLTVLDSKTERRFFADVDGEAAYETVLDSGTGRRCSADADGEGDNLTVLDSGTERNFFADADGEGDNLTVLDSRTIGSFSADADGEAGNVTVLDSGTERNFFADADGEAGYVTVLDSGIGRRCSADADGEGGYATVLDSGTEQNCSVDADGEAGYVTVLDSGTEQNCSVDADGEAGYVTVLDAGTGRRCSADADGEDEHLTVLDSGTEQREAGYVTVLDPGTGRRCSADADGEGGYVTVLDSGTRRRCSADADGEDEHLTVHDSDAEKSG